MPRIPAAPMWLFTRAGGESTNWFYCTFSFLRIFLGFSEGQQKVHKAANRTYPCALFHTESSPGFLTDLRYETVARPVNKRPAQEHGHRRTKNSAGSSVLSPKFFPDQCCPLLYFALSTLQFALNDVVIIFYAQRNSQGSIRRHRRLLVKNRG